MRTILKIKGKAHNFTEYLGTEKLNNFSCFLPVLGMDTQNPFPYKALRFGSYDLP